MQPSEPRLLIECAPLSVFSSVFTSLEERIVVHEQVERIVFINLDLFLNGANQAEHPEVIL